MTSRLTSPLYFSLAAGAAGDLTQAPVQVFAVQPGKAYELRVWGVVGVAEGNRPAPDQSWVTVDETAHPLRFRPTVSQVTVACFGSQASRAWLLPLDEDGGRR